MTTRDAYRDVSQLAMRIANLRDGAGYALGVETPKGVLDVTATASALGLPAPRDVDDLLQRGLGAQVAAVVEAAAADPRRAVVIRGDAVVFAPLVTRPRKILCVGFNYRKHAEETGTEVGDHPPLFAKFSNALNHDGGTVPLPATARWFDYETELVVVVGRRCSTVSEDEALDYVAGYATGNDISARDLQTQTPQLTAGKIADGFAPVGPWLVTADRVPDPNSLRLQTHVNGEQRQDWNTNDMIFTCRQLIAYIAGIVPLEPGDILFTGTPQGVIFGQPQPPEERAWLTSGDQVVSEIEGLGALTVTMA